MGSLAAIAFGVLAGCLSAQEPAEPGLLKLIPPSQSKAEKCAKPRSRYLADLSEIKRATLESETAFFDRLEKENKLEAMQTLISDAKARMQSVRRNLLPPGIDQLEDSAQDLCRVREALDTVARNLSAARTDLRQYHQRSSPEAVAVAAGRTEAGSLFSRIRRYVKSAEYGLRTVRDFNLAKAQEKIDAAAQSLQKTLEAMKQDDPGRADLQKAVAAIDRARAALAEANNHTGETVELLEKTRRQYLPDCSNDAVQKRTFTLLNETGPALELLEQADAKRVDIWAALDRLEDAAGLAIQQADQADALMYEKEGDVRRRGRDVEQLLADAEDELSHIRLLLTGEGPEVTSTCEHCGKVLMRTRKVMDPDQACARTEGQLGRIMVTIRRVQLLAEQIGETLDEVKQNGDPARTARVSLARRQLRGDQDRGDPGVLGNLKLALDRGTEFRNQRFDFYPGQASPPTVAAVAPRSFPAMEATYVARETWRYPTYFEDLNLERYGNSFGIAQPAVSYGKFLADLAFLPYKVWLDRPYERQYTLGLCRPGDDVPHMIYLPEPNLGAAAFEGAVWTGLIFFP